MKTLIIYVFHKMNRNVLSFICKHVFDHPDFKFLIVCNSMDLDITVPSYVTFIKRDNIGFDFGAWSVALLEGDRYLEYDYFVFINSSVAGPFYPPYFKGYWPTILTQGLTKDIKLYGSTINCYDEYGKLKIEGVHVQSFAFATDRIGLDVLINSGIFSVVDFETDFVKTVVEREIRMSKEIIAAGYNIGCLLRYYDGIDFRTDLRNHTTFMWLPDIMYDMPYKKMGLHPYETVFIKTNRNIEERIYQKYL